MAPAKLLGFLLLLVICLKYVDSGKSKQKIKIHVPYYVKHIHHYKKVYVPKVQVVKHEHLHKKEHEHHHHHDHHDHHHIKHVSHDHGYDKSSDGGYNDEYDLYYDDIDHRSYNDGSKSNRLAKSRQKTPKPDEWTDPSSEELTSSEEEDYITGGSIIGFLCMGCFRSRRRRRYIASPSHRQHKASSTANKPLTPSTIAKRSQNRRRWIPHNC